MGVGGIQNLSFTGGSGNSAQNNNSLGTWFKTEITASGHLTPSQLQAAYPAFNPNLFYTYYYDGTSSHIFYNYIGQGSSAPPGGVYSIQNFWLTTTSTTPNTLAYNNGSTQVYYIIPPGTTTGTTGSYGTTYQVPASIGSNPLKATSTTVTQPVNLTYYASLPYGQDIAPGVYTDTVVIQVTF